MQVLNTNKQATHSRVLNAYLRSIAVEHGNQTGINAQSAPKYAGFWRRSGAFVIDYLVANEAIAILFLLGYAITGQGGLGRLESFMVLWLIMMPLGAIIAWLYWAIMESSSNQATLGKMALGIIITDNQGNRISFARATIRFWAKFISMAIFWIGFLMAGFTSKRQGLHDMISECFVVEKE